MRERKVTVIPATNPNEPNKRLGTPGKIHVVGYARVMKGTGAGVQIRKNIRKLITDRPGWELIFVTTDHRETEDQELTWRLLRCICYMIRNRELDVLIFSAPDVMKDTLAAIDFQSSICNDNDVKFYAIHDGLLVLGRRLLTRHL